MYSNMNDFGYFFEYMIYLIALKLLSLKMTRPCSSIGQFKSVQYFTQLNLIFFNLLNVIHLYILYYRLIRLVSLSLLLDYIIIIIIIHNI